MPQSDTHEQLDLSKELFERFKLLPKVVQNAIMSADVEKHMRELCDKNHLHLDQWGALENEVMLTLLGVQNAENLTENIERHVGLSPEVAVPLTESIMQIVFDPIREELERQLEHPEAKAVEESTVEAARTQTLAQESEQNQTQETATLVPAVTPTPIAAAPPALPPQPLAPLPQPPEDKATRASIAPSYASSAASHERKTIEGDPYREQIA